LRVELRRDQRQAEQRCDAKRAELQLEARRRSDLGAKQRPREPTVTA
jgi:hypothetical protein